MNVIFKIVATVLLGCAIAAAQLPLLDKPQHTLAKSPAAVEYLFPEQVTIPAGKPSAVTLHFRVAPGLHINSHTPKDSYLIPTAFTIPAGEGVALKEATYPKGTDVALPLDPKTRLNVYAGEFVIDTRIVAERGNHLVQAKLRYQACDNNECMPPKTLSVAIDVIGN